MKICEWCGNEIETDNDQRDVDGMHEVCNQAAIREARIADSVESDYDPQV